MKIKKSEIKELVKEVLEEEGGGNTDELRKKYKNKLRLALRSTDQLFRLWAYAEDEDKIGKWSHLLTNLDRGWYKIFGDNLR